MTPINTKPPLSDYQFILERVTADVQTVTAVHRTTGQRYVVDVNGRYSSGNAVISGIAKLKGVLP